jgi:hypothetical protein
VRGQCQLLDKNHQYFQLFHCQQTQSLLITLYLKLIQYRPELSKCRSVGTSDKVVRHDYGYFDFLFVGVILIKQTKISNFDKIFTSFATNYLILNKFLLSFYILTIFFVNKNCTQSLSYLITYS